MESAGKHIPGEKARENTQPAMKGTKESESVGNHIPGKKPIAGAIAVASAEDGLYTGCLVEHIEKLL